MYSFYLDNIPEAGCDEAGRGALAGPVYAAAVILPKDFYHPGLNDSKQINRKNREILRVVIEREAIAYGIGYATNEEIDKINILNASILAMHRALDRLWVRPESIIVDGNKFLQYEKIPHKCFIKGDSIYASIAAASILAKTYRDDYMSSIDKEFPQYCWSANMGYPTMLHKTKIKEHGACKYHRNTFRL